MQDFRKELFSAKDRNEALEIYKDKKPYFGKEYDWVKSDTLNELAACPRLGAYEFRVPSGEWLGMASKVDWHPNLLAELEAWEKGIILCDNPSSDLLLLAFEEDRYELTEQLLNKGAVVTPECFSKCDEKVAYMLLRKTRVTREMIVYLTRPELIDVAMPYLTGFTDDEIKSNCRVENLESLSYYGFKVRDPKHLLRAFHSFASTRTINFLEGSIGLTPKLREIARDHEWYWLHRAFYREKEDLLASLNMLRPQVAHLFAKKAERDGPFDEQRAIQELALLPAYMVPRLLDMWSCPCSLPKVEWRSDAALRAFEAAVSVTYNHDEIHCWRSLWP